MVLESELVVMDLLELTDLLIRLVKAGESDNVQFVKYYICNNFVRGNRYEDRENYDG